MRISINKTVLLKSLPDGLPHEWPEMIELDGEQVAYQDDPMQKRYPDMFELLTKREWYMFCRLVATGFARKGELLGGAHIAPESMNFDNNVVTHIKNLRRRLEDTPYRIRTIKGRGYAMTPNEAQSGHANTSTGSALLDATAQPSTQAQSTGR